MLKVDLKWPKSKGILSFSTNFVITFFWIFCEMKFHIISFVTA